MHQWSRIVVNVLLRSRLSRPMNIYKITGINQKSEQPEVKVRAIIVTFGLRSSGGSVGMIIIHNVLIDGRECPDAQSPTWTVNVYNATGITWKSEQYKVIVQATIVTFGLISSRIVWA